MCKRANRFPNGSTEVDLEGPILLLIECSTMIMLGHSHSVLMPSMNQLDPTHSFPMWPMWPMWCTHPPIRTTLDQYQ